jgi:hypothetical protein
MCAARRVRITYDLTSADAARDAAGAPDTWWDEATEELRRGLAELGGQDAATGRDRLDADRCSARFTTAIPAGVVSEAVRLTMSWVGRSPHREATLTGPGGDVLPLTGERGPEEIDLIATWLAATTAPAG